MRILVDQSSYQLSNVGDSAMLTAGLTRMQALWPGCEVRVLASSSERLSEVWPGAQYADPRAKDRFLQVGGLIPGAFRLRAAKYDGTVDKVERRLRSMSPVRVAAAQHRYGAWRRLVKDDAIITFAAELEAADAVVTTGGGFLTDVFLEHGMSVLRLLELAQSLGKPTAMFGQGLGPMRESCLRSACERVLPRLDVLSLREGRFGLPLLKQLGVGDENVRVTGDDAIALAVGQPVEATRTCIGLNVRVANYADIDRSQCEALTGQVLGMAAALGADVRPVRISPTEDWAGTERVSALSGEGGTGELLTLAHTLQDIAGCRVIATCSYHAAVFALSMGIPVVGLYRSV